MVASHDRNLHNEVSHNSALNFEQINTKKQKQKFEKLYKTEDTNFWHLSSYWVFGGNQQHF